MRKVKVGDAIVGGSPFALIAGPCVIEDYESARDIAAFLKAATGELGIPFIFKASYDKANRTSLESSRGPGASQGLEILGTVRDELGVPVLSDVHSVEEVERAANVLDALQIPAFLCRQTDLLQAVAATGKPLNIKKGQFLAPWDMKHVIGKIEAVKNNQIMLTERGCCFGYNNLVVDFRSIEIMRRFGYPIVFDATHSVQLPSGAGSRSGGQSEFIPTLARAAIANRVDALFLEVHPSPERALCDGPNSLKLDDVPALLKRLLSIWRAAGDEALE